MFTSTKNEANVGYLREETHKPIALEFRVRVCCLSLSWS